MIYENVVLENYLANQKDILYNKDKFDNGEINLCFITGHSGSGKSTLGGELSKAGNSEWYELDDVIFNDHFSMANLKEYGDLMYNFFNGIGKKYYQKNFKNYEKEIIVDFVKYAKSYAKQYPKRRIILDGVWLFMYIEPSELKDYAVYIKGTSAIISTIRAMKRDKKIEGQKWNLKRLKNEVMSMPEFERGINKYRSYFDKNETGFIRRIY